MSNLASAVDELLAVEVRGLPAAALAAEIVELRRQINRLESVYLAMLEVIDRSGAMAADHGSTAAWVRGALRLSPQAASRDVHLARDLADALPATRAAMADGELSPAHAQAIASVRPYISDEALASAEPHLVDAARLGTPKELHGLAAHVRNSYAPEKVLGDEADDYDNRRLYASTTIGGVGVGDWTLHAVGHETVMTALHAASRPVSGDDRTPAQRRADALVTIAEIALRSGDLPITGGVKPHVSVIVGWDTLAGVFGAQGADFGFGAVSSGEWARRLACDAEVSRIVTGPAGEILDVGRSARTFTAAQQRAIAARDRQCIWPGCDMPPGWCHAHHRVHWARGGATSVGNGTLLCGRHHDRVHQHGHAIIATPSGPYRVDVRQGSDPQWQGPHQRAGP